MILIQDERPLDPEMAERRARVLDVARRGSHAVHVFTSIDTLEAFLEDGLDQLEAAGLGRGLRRVALFHSSPRAVHAVATRMAPGCTFEAWPQPDCWRELFEQLRTKQHAFARL